MSLVFLAQQLTGAGTTVQWKGACEPSGLNIWGHSGYLLQRCQGKLLSRNTSSATNSHERGLLARNKGCQMQL